MINIIVKVIIIYLIYRLVSVVLVKAARYYRAYKQVQRKRREQAVRDQSRFNLDAFDVEDATFEDIKTGKSERSGSK